tara:strand:+ start:652 stop:1266 length:615 start_codon:yes stop_codon:yes gene_type:complete
MKKIILLLIIFSLGCDQDPIFGLKRGWLLLSDCPGLLEAYTESYDAWYNPLISSSCNDMIEDYQAGLDAGCEEFTENELAEVESICDGGGGGEWVYGCTDWIADNYGYNCAWDWVGDPDVDDGCCNYDLECSDYRLKKDIDFVGSSPSGIKIYEFGYKDAPGRYRGVMAQDLLDTEYRDAVSKNSDGYYIVDYSKIDVELKRID